MEILEILSGMPWWIIALVVTACGLLWRAGRWTGRVDTRLDSLESKLGALESKLDALAKELRGKLDKLLERSPPQDTAAALSPLRLTNLGESISASLGVSRWAAEKAETLVVQVRSGENSEYDIQELCFEYVRNDSNFDLAMRNAMKAQAYENGLEIDQVRRVFGIELRDAVLVLMASAT